MLSRAGMFRVSEGVGVDMKDRVYDLHSFYSKFRLLLISACYIVFLSFCIIDYLILSFITSWFVIYV